MRHPSVKHHPSPLGHGWVLISGHCRPVRHTRPALPSHLPASGPSEDSEEEESNMENEQGDDEKAWKRREDSSESDESETSDLD